MIESTIAQNWRTALDRFKLAERAVEDWRARNPSLVNPSHDDEARWETGSDAVGWPYGQAAEALAALPAPDLHAVIVKIGLIRLNLDGYCNETEVGHALDFIEKDLKRLARCP